MATADEIIRDRLNRIDEIPVRFIDKVNASQTLLFNELIEVLSELQVTGGDVVLSEANLIRIDELMEQYYQRLRSGKYGSLVSGYMNQFDAQRNLIDEFTDIEFNAVASAASVSVYNNSKRIALRQLIGDDFKTNFINVIRDQVVDSVQNEVQFSQMVQNLKQSFTNEGVDGQILNWVKQVSRDRFAITDRSYNNAIAQQLSLVFGQYSGGIIPDTRPFCSARNGKYYHIEEVYDWASLSPWQGRYRRTTESNIIDWLGGYNCNHVFVFRSLRNVPKTDIQRNISNGNFTPNRAERELLGL